MDVHFVGRVIRQQGWERNHPRPEHYATASLAYHHSRCGVVYEAAEDRHRCSG